MHFAVISDPKREAAVKPTFALMRLLEAHGATYTHYPCACAEIAGDFAVALGGDGTLMHTAKYAAQKKIPVIGVNVGRVGYLAQLEPADILLLERLFTGDYTVEKRMMLKVRAHDKTYYAINDAVISNDTVTRIVKIGAYCDGRPIGSYFADGVILATPTGSTAYSLSAGGSVIDPALSCICFTPICPISSLARPIVFAKDSVLEFENLADGNFPLRLTVDGVLVGQVLPGETVRVCRAELQARFLSVKPENFCDVLRQKRRRDTE